jgi:hypothetical protein
MGEDRTLQRESCAMKQAKGMRLASGVEDATMLVACYRQHPAAYPSGWPNNAPNNTE